MRRAVFIIFVVTLASLGAVSSAPGGPPQVRSLAETRYQFMVRQQWDLSCAAAALATVLRYQHGVPVTEKSVALGLIGRKEYLKNPDLIRIRQGFSFLDLKRYVTSIGLEGNGLGQLAFSDLPALAPLIVPVNLKGFPHFVVFRGVARGRVLLADPAFGNLTMPQFKFMDAWINYQGLGRVAFQVTSPGRPGDPGRLLGKPSDFFSLR